MKNTESARVHLLLFGIESFFPNMCRRKKSPIRLWYDSAGRTHNINRMCISYFCVIIIQINGF